MTKLMIVGMAFIGMGLSSSAKASEGALILCVSSDREVIARAKPQVGRASIIKVRQGLPLYDFDGCEVRTGSSQLMTCIGAGNRTFILNADLTARYIGSRETREFTCQHAGHSGN